jgi:c-di-AMP phosphodiesterase-like protein
MEKQTYRNHIRFYTPHHFIFYPILMILFAISVYKICTSDDALIWLFISIILIFFIFLGLMLRQHYALTLQNRIVKLELRYRYFSISGKKFEDFENQLQEDQLFALRFAPDDELINLVEKALTEKLSGKAIKKSIINWKGDYERV